MNAYVRFYRQLSIEDWAKMVLSPEELIDFQTSLEENQQLWQQYKDTGLITVEPIYETFSISALSDSVQLQVGEKVVLSPTTSTSNLVIADRYRYWLDRFYEENGPDPVQFVANIA